MNFTWLNRQGVESDAGFILQCVGRFEWEYREGEKVISLSGESIVGGGNHGFAFSRDWLPSPLSNEQRLRVQQNVTAAMNFMDLKAEFD